jgi:hypothetical protein
MRCPALPRGPEYWRRVELVASEANGTFVATRPTRGENVETAHRGTFEPSDSPDTRAIPPLDRTRAECSSQVCVAAVCTPPPAGYSGADGHLEGFSRFARRSGCRGMSRDGITKP